MTPPDLRPLAFNRVEHGDVRPPMFDGDHTRGEDFVIGTLKSLHHGKDVIAFIVAFEPGPDAQAGDPKCVGELEFVVAKREANLVGRISRRAPEGFCKPDDYGEWKRVDGLGTGPGIGGRAAANFYTSPQLGRYTQFGVSAYFKSGLFGGWKEIIVRTPKKTLYAAYP
jgi:hypothetical protein